MAGTLNASVIVKESLTAVNDFLHLQSDKQLFTASLRITLVIKNSFRLSRVLL